MDLKASSMTPVNLNIWLYHAMQATVSGQKLMHKPIKDHAHCCGMNVPLNFVGLLFWKCPIL